MALCIYLLTDDLNLALPDLMGNPELYLGVEEMNRYTITLEEVEIVVCRKAVKNVNFTIYPPDGRVQVSVPNRMADKQLQQILNERLDWIKKSQRKVMHTVAMTELAGESDLTVQLFGQEVQIDIQHGVANGYFQFIEDGKLRIGLTGDIHKAEIQRTINEWLRFEIKKRIPPLIDYWQKKIGVEINEWRVKKMKTRWGTCNITAKRIWLNLHLAKFPIECLEYVIVHELVHLLERYHNPRFWGLVESHLPEFRRSREFLRRGESSLY